MKISNEMIEQIKEFEGCRNEAYLDSKGVPTIGIGHTGPDVTMGDKISSEEINRLFRKDVATAENAVNRLNAKMMEKTKGGESFTQQQFDALVDLVYNAGAASIGQTSTMYRVMLSGNRYNYEQVCHTFMMWVKITDPKTGQKIVLGGKDGKHGLVLRRAIASAWYVYGPNWKQKMETNNIVDVVEWAKN